MKERAEFFISSLCEKKEKSRGKKRRKGDKGSIVILKSPENLSIPESKRKEKEKC